MFEDPLAQELDTVEEAPPELEKLEKPMDLDREPFILLPEKYLQLQSSANRIDRAPDLRLLAHFAWRQPLDQKQRAAPVLVQAGYQFDLDFELEGTLTASKNRYLHMDSALYFSRYERSLVTDRTNWSSFYITPTRGDTNNQTAGNTQPGLSSTFSATDLDIFGAQATDDFDRTMSASAITSRRLKSTELHYIDHPLFGILVSMTPHEIPDPVLEMRDFNIEALPEKKVLPVVPIESPQPGGAATLGNSLSGNQ